MKYLIVFLVLLSSQAECVCLNLLVGNPPTGMAMKQVTAGEQEGVFQITVKIIKDNCWASCASGWPKLLYLKASDPYFDQKYALLLRSFSSGPFMSSLNYVCYDNETSRTITFIASGI